MNRLLTILLLAAGTAYGQINNPPTSVNIVDSTATGRAVLTATNAAAAATAVGLGETNSVTFSQVTVTNTFYPPTFTSTNGFYGAGSLRMTGSSTNTRLVYRQLGVTPADRTVLNAEDNLINLSSASVARTNLGLGATWLTNTSATNFRTAIGLGATNDVTFSNVTVNGNLSVGSFTTTTPSTWALDATQTAAATNGILTLPSNANVIRLTNNNAISSVTNGVLGAFYFVVNQATNAVTISNVGGITVDGAQNLTLSPNESATLVATGPTNASVAARGDLNNVTLTGVDNLATQQTASSASSLMTRELTDTRMVDYIMHAPNRFRNLTYAMASTISGTGTAVHAGPISEGRVNVRIVNGSTNSFASVKVNRQGPWNGLEGSAGVDWSRPMSLVVMGSKEQITDNVTRAFLVFGAGSGDNDLPTNGHWVALNWVNSTNAQVLVSKAGVVTTNATVITTSRNPAGFGVWIDHKTNGTGDIYYAERTSIPSAALQKPTNATVTYSNGPMVISTNQTSLTFGLVGLSTNVWGGGFEIVGLNNAVFFAP